jgi:YaiO family outer membrane protein
VEVTSRLQRADDQFLPSHQLLWGYGVSDLNETFFSNWRDRFMEYRHFSNNGNQQFLRVEHDHRFDLHDSMLELGFLLGARSSVPIDLAIGITEDAEFLPEYRIRLGTHWQIRSLLPGASVLSLGVQQARYATGTTRNLSLNLDYYVANTNLWFTPGIGLLEDEHGERRSTWQLGIHDQLTSRWRIGFNYIDAPETDNNITLDSRSGHFYMAYQWSDAIAVRVDLARNLRQDSYTRESTAVSLQYRF